MLLLFILAACGQEGDTEESDEEITVTDLAGREVTLDKPADTAAVQSSGSGGAFMTLMALYGKDIDEHIAGWDLGLEKNRYDMWETFSEEIPGLEDIPDIGNMEQDTFNTEQAIAADPDVLILPLNDEEAAKDTIEKMDEAGIPTVFIDYHAQDPEHHEDSIELLGELFGEEEKAQEITDFYDKEIEKVTSRLEEVDEEKPTVYIESGDGGPDEYSNTYGNMMWGELVDLYGGENITRDAVENAEPIQSEFLLKENPDIIMITGSYWPNNPDSMRLGFLSEEDESQELLHNFTERTGWDELDAVKNDRVYSVHHALAREIYDFAAIQYMAKVFYPDEFEDIDPEENLAAFYDEFYPVELKGLWTMHLEDE